MNREYEILKKRGYFVKVENFGENKIKVIYPAFNLLEQKYPAFSKEYELADGGVIMDGEFVALPFFLRRTSIFCDILCQCQLLKINYKLIYYYRDNKEVKSIFESLKMDLTPEDKEKESKIYQMCISNEVPIEEQKPFYRSFKMMKGLVYG